MDGKMKHCNFFFFTAYKVLTEKIKGAYNSMEADRKLGVRLVTLVNLDKIFLLDN